MTTEKKIEQYRKWLQEEVKVRKNASSMAAAMVGMGMEESLRKLNEMFPEPIAVSVQEAGTANWSDKSAITHPEDDQQDDTDRLYPR